MSPPRVSRSYFAALAIGVTAAVAASGCDGTVKDSCFDITGSVCTWAGTGDPAFNGDWLHRIQSALYWPVDLEFSPDGDAYLLDWQNHRVRRVVGGQVLETVIGTDDVGDGPAQGNELSDPGVPGTTVSLNHPTDVVFDASGIMILSAWHNHKLRRFDPATAYDRILAGGQPGFSGDGMDAQTAQLNQPKGAVVSARDGAIYVVDARNVRVRRIDAATHVIDTVAGGAPGYGGDGGPPLAASFMFQKDSDNPEPGGAIAIDADNRLYVADTENQRIRRIDLDAGVVDTVAGNGTAGFGGDGGAATDASLNYPRDVEIAPDGRLFIADTDNHCVRAVDLGTGVITTVAGQAGQRGFAGDGDVALSAQFNRPFGIAFDAAGDLYVADTFNNRIRKVVRP
jgi:DNA-binding beta-propeller fold protein YncE